MLQRAALLTVFLAAAVFSAGAAADLGGAQSATFAVRVNRICAGGLLFEHRHVIGTRAGALAVAGDIRKTGTRRLRRVADVPRPVSEEAVIERWLVVERRLVAAYARDYLLIWNAIEAAKRPAQHAHLSARLHALVHEPDALKRQAEQYELNLGVPDCTGGGN